jgi:hypothetical protein
MLAVLWVGGHRAAIASALIAFLFVALAFLIPWFFDTYLRDESGSGWCFSQDGYAGIFGLGLDFKIGGFAWLHWGYIWGLGSFITPCGYGGSELGIEGI